MKISKYSKILILSISFLFVFSNKAFAYIDPGYGSYIIQMIIALGLGVAYFLKQYWLNFISFLKGIFKKDNKKHEK